MRYPMIALMLLTATPPSVHAETFVVRMLNRGEAGAMVFEPDLVMGKVGDTVRFVPVDRGHSAETIAGMIPNGVEMVYGELDREVKITLHSEGVYGIRCGPHYDLGMVAMLVAGEPVNLEQAMTVEFPSTADERFNDIAARIAGN